MNETRREILDQMALTLFVQAFASECDDPDSDFDGNGQTASMGTDWFDTVTDPTPQSAHDKALEIADKFEATNGWTIAQAYEFWLTLDHKYARSEPDMEKFGHYLAMESVGHGVGLWDDTCETPEDRKRFDTGYHEYYFDPSE